MKHYAQIQIEQGDKYIVPARRHVYHASKQSAERALDQAARKIHRGRSYPEIRGFVINCKTKEETTISL